MYLSVTSELLNLLLNDPHLVPRSSYRKAIGEGVRTITYGAHTSLAALQKSHKFVTNITTADKSSTGIVTMPQVGYVDAQVDSISVYYSCGVDHRRRFSPTSGYTKSSTLPEMQLFHSESGKVVSFKLMKMISGLTRTLVINGLSWMPEIPFIE